MSDDEVLRRRAPFVALAAVGCVLAFGLWLRGRVTEDARVFQAFCSATHPGEAWEHVQERAAARGWGFVRQNQRGGPVDEWLCQVELWSYHAGCVVTVAKGRVTQTHFAELP